MLDAIATAERPCGDLEDMFKTDVTDGLLGS